MVWRISEFAKLTGVSVRTLHHYHKIGLLAPCCVDKTTAYRYYNEASLRQMQQILFYRELDFSLADIAQLLAAPGYNRQTAFAQQKHLLL